jgi:hypothetical protein
MTIKQKILQWMMAITFVVGVGGAGLAIVTPQPAAAACSDMLLTFPAWYKGLLDGNCNVKNPNDVGGLSQFIWKIAFNVITIGLNLVGYLSVGFIIFGGYKYMISAGAADGMVKARKTIFNAVIGLVISIFSIAIVNVIAGSIK